VTILSRDYVTVILLADINSAANSKTAVMTSCHMQPVTWLRWWSTTTTKQMAFV